MSNDMESSTKNKNAILKKNSSSKIAKQKNIESVEKIESIKTNRISIRQIFILIAIVLSIFFGYEIGNRPFANPDEGRYVEIPREMVVTGDYITPRLNGLKYFEKPPLFYWLQAATIKNVGINECSMRFWPAFFAIVGCLSVFGVGVVYGSVSTGLMSAVILATSLLYYALSHMIILDLVVSIFMSGVLWCFFLAFVARRRRRTENNGKKGSRKTCQTAAVDSGYDEVGIDLSEKTRKFLIILMYALAALAALTKGLIGFILPGFVGFLWLTFSRNWNWKKVREIFYIPGILVFLVILLPWHIMVCSRNDDFFHFYFVVEHWLRYTTQIHKRYQPVWYFVPIILLGLLPWTGFCLTSLKDSFRSLRNPERNSEDIFLLSWIFGIFAFYSFSSSKLIPYILPVFPPIAFLTARMISKIKTASDSNFMLGSCLNIFLFALVIVAFLSFKDRIWDITTDFPEIFVLMKVFAIILGVFILLLLYLVFFGKQKSIGNSLILYVFLAVNMMWILNKSAPFYQDIKRPSAKDMAEFVRMNFVEKNGDEVFCYKRYQQDFPVYLGRTVGVSDYLGELRFGYNAEKNDRIISGEQLWERWKKGDKRIFVLMTRSEYQKFFTQNIPHVLLNFDRNFVIIINDKKNQES